MRQNVGGYTLASSNVLGAHNDKRWVVWSPGAPAKVMTVILAVL